MQKQTEKQLLNSRKGEILIYQWGLTDKSGMVTSHKNELGSTLSLR